MAIFQANFQLTLRLQDEGQEADRILGFYPTSVSIEEQTAMVGLVQATLVFSSVFSQVPTMPNWSL